MTVVPTTDPPVEPEKDPPVPFVREAATGAGSLPGETGRRRARWDLPGAV